MNEPILEAEIVAPAEAKLVKFAGQTGLEPVATTTLVAAFRPVFVKASEVLASAVGVAESVKDATCVTEIKKSRACRLAIRAVRIEGEKVHKAQKENALRFGRAVDGFKNILLADLEPVEKALQEAEDVAERAEALRLAALKTQRVADLAPYGVDASLMNIENMPPDHYAQLLAATKSGHEAKLAAAAKAEAERIASEKAEADERARVLVENERLKVEAVAREAAAKAEREKAEAAARAAAELAAKERAEIEAKAKAEKDALEAAARAERLRLQALADVERQKVAAAEAEAQRLRDVEAVKVATAAAAAKKAANAPDREKLLAFAAAIRSMPAPPCATASGQALVQRVGIALGKISAGLEVEAGNL